jgi:hypothetical protein
LNAVLAAILLLVTIGVAAYHYSYSVLKEKHRCATDERKKLAGGKGYTSAQENSVLCT